MKPLRILAIHPFLRGEKVNPRAGGKSRVSLMLTQYLIEQGNEVAIYPWPERIWGDVERFAAGPGCAAAVYPTLSLPSMRGMVTDPVRTALTSFPPRGGRSFVEDACFLAGLKSAVRLFRPDLIHCHQTKSDIPALLRAAGHPVPAILTHHSGSSGPQLDAYDRILFISQAMQEEIRRRIRYPLERSGVIYYPIAEEFRSGSIVPAAERRGIVCVGALKAAKGIDLLLEAFRTEPELRRRPLILCGTGEDEETYRDFARDHELAVEFRGRLSVAEVRRAVAGAELLVNPSRMEGFSVALLEALACGTPVVGWASQVGELAELNHAPVGFPFDGRCQTADALAEIVLNALSDPLLATKSREDLARFSRERFSVERFGRENLESYRLLLSGAGG